ncbi:DASS family sodium-coupled anion symporter [Peribacillus saganii]|uniref:Sodium-dependent dicarboxylate transporter SdcS n=1 Tax=Peribacillus saganii TaxID=2303992 RepID=A0A372LUB2_9BACI|nr:DASS family sodium-coupled anion symporter [Peribacillus saganii]RFU71390.1 DASS family sodium-coupled anion symporter [Peribacillus saganii]
MADTSKEGRTQSRGKIYFSLSIIFLLLIVSPFFPPLWGMTEKGAVTLLVLFFGIILWLTNIIPSAVTSIVIMVLLPFFHVLSFEESAAGLGSDVVFLIIIMLCMGKAVEKTGLDRRLAFYVLSKSKGNSSKTIFYVILIAFLLTFFIPNGMARLTVLLPISLGLIDTLKDENDDHFNKSIMLAITYVPWICTVTLITGSNGAIYAASLFKSMIGFEWTYIHWMIVMLPLIAFTLIGLWAILVILFPPKQKHITSGQIYIQNSLRELGKLKMAEKKIIVLYACLILLWLTKELHGYSIAMSACLVGVFIFLPGIELIKWKEAMRSINWGIPLLFAAGFTIANAFEQSGLMVWLSELAANSLKNLPVSVVALTIMLIFVVIRIGFTHYAAMIASLLPVAITFALATPFNPVWIGMICVVASTISYIMPTQSIGNMTTYSLGLYTMKDMAKAGGLLTVLIIILTIGFAYWYWPLAGVPISL